MTRQAEWVGGPYDGQRLELELENSIDYRFIVQTSEPASPTESASIPANWEAVAVPVRPWSDGTFRLLWSERKPRV